MKPILIVGGDSLLGAVARRIFQQQHGVAVMTTSRRSGAEWRVDLAADADSWQLPAMCAVAVLCAARSRLEECEEQPAETHRVNVTQTLELARRLRDRGAFVIFLSTNLVFRGERAPYSASAPPDPVCAYGRQKAEAERALLEMGNAAAIVRLSKVVHAGMPLLRGWVETLRRGESIRAFRNLRFSPISPEFVAEALWRIAERRLAGITQLSGSGQISYADLALALARRLGADEPLVIPTDVPDGPARSAALEAERATRELGLPPPDVAQTVGELIDSLA